MSGPPDRAAVVGRLADVFERFNLPVTRSVLDELAAVTMTVAAEWTADQRDTAAAPPVPTMTLADDSPDGPPMVETVRPHRDTVATVREVAGTLPVGWARSRLDACAGRLDAAECGATIAPTVPVVTDLILRDWRFIVGDERDDWPELARLAAGDVIPSAAMLAYQAYQAAGR